MKYLKELKFEDIGQVLWFNIQTEPLEKEMSVKSAYFPAWAQKVSWDENIHDNEDALNRYELKAGLYKEFSKINSLCYGRISDGELKVKVLSYDDEKQLIEEFYSDVQKFVAGGVKFLGGFSVLGFSLPFISFRATVNDIEDIPSFDAAGLKSWNIKHIICLNELLRGTSGTNISLLGATAAFKLPHYDEESLPESLLATANLFNKYLRQPLSTLLEVGVMETKQLPLLERIMAAGEINKEDERAIVAAIKDFSPEEKLIALEQVKACVKGGKISKTLENKFKCK